MKQFVLTAVIAAASCLWCPTATAQITVFFDSSQVATDVSSDVNTDTISSNGYLFTYTRDKLFTGGVGLPDPIGRAVRIPWPQGVEAQAVTVGPNIGMGAQIIIRRVDGLVFDLPAFTFQLLANTGGAGANIEIMPILNGEDAFNDPFFFFASGYYGSVFSYDTTTPSYLGNTTPLTGYEAYKITLYVDFALTALTLEAIVPNPADITGDGFVDLSDLLVMSEQWLQVPAVPSGDIAPPGGDGWVDLLDFTFLAANWQ